MANNAPGRHSRKGITIAQFFRMFPDDEAAEKWIVNRRWPDEVCCPKCGSLNVNTGAKRKSMPFRCRERVCDANFSAKTGTFMQSSKMGYRDWLFAIYLVTTNLKGVSSMKLHRDLGITQKSAWHMAHRIRKALQSGGLFAGPVEVDETYVGGRQRNMSAARREQLPGGGSSHLTAVVGARDRATRQVAAEVVRSTSADTLQEFVGEHAEPGATVYTDGSRSYSGLPFEHDTVCHSLQEYVRGDVHTNGIESLWAVLKRAHKGVFHRMSPKHLDRYVQEVAGKHNLRDLDTLEQMGAIVGVMQDTRLTYRQLIADNGLPSGARA